MTKTELDYYENVVAPKQFNPHSRHHETHITDKKHPRHEGYKIKQERRTPDKEEEEAFEL